MRTPRCLSIASSDSGGGAGIQADVKAFAAAGCHGSTVVVALTAQNTLGVTSIVSLDPSFIQAQFAAVVDDIGVDAAKTGMLFSADIINTVADALYATSFPLVVDPVMVSASGSRLLQDDAVAALVARLFPRATVVTPNLPEAQALTGAHGTRRELAERLVAMGAAAAIVTGGHGQPPVDHLFDGTEHVEIPVPRHELASTHGAGCTHSATLTALLARGLSLRDAAAEAARRTAEAVLFGHPDVGGGDGPVDVIAAQQGVTAVGVAAERPRVAP